MIILTTTALALFLLFKGGEKKAPNRELQKPLDEKRAYLLKTYVKPEIQGSEILQQTIPQMLDVEVDFFITHEDEIFRKTQNPINWESPVVQKAFQIFKKYLPNLESGF